MDEDAARSLLELAEQAGPALQGLNRTELLAQLEERHADLLAALQWYIDEGRTDEAIRIAGSLSSFWTSTKRVDEGCEWFERALASPGGDDAVRGRGCFEAGLLVFWTGDDERATALHSEALALGRGSGNPTVTALALTGLARIALRTDIAEARRLCREALEVLDGVHDPRRRSNAVHVLGVAAQMSGDLLEARELMTERMALARELGSYLGLASEAANLSMVERQLGNLDRADELVREALEIARQREDEWLFPYALSGLAANAAERGDYERAATLIGAAEAMMEAQGTDWPPDERPHYERTVATLTEAMPEFERVRAVGRVLSSGDAVEFALS